MRHLDSIDLQRANRGVEEASQLLYAPIEASIAGQAVGFYVEYVFNFSIFVATIRDNLPGPAQTLAGSDAARDLQAIILTAMEVGDSDFILGIECDMLDSLGEFLDNFSYRLQLRAFRIAVLVRRSREAESVLDRLIRLSIVAALHGEAERLLPIARNQCVGDPEKTELFQSAERMLRLAISGGAPPAAAPWHEALTGEDAEALGSEGSHAFNEYQATGRPELLDAAVAAYSRAASAMPTREPGRQQQLSNLSAALGMRYSLRGDSADLNTAIDAALQAAYAASVHQVNGAGSLSNLARLLLNRFGETGARSDLDAAVEAAERAVTEAPENSDRRGRYLSTLGICLRERFYATGNDGDLDASIEAGRLSLAAESSEDLQEARRMSSLSLSLRTRFQHQRDLADLDEAVDLGQRAAAAAEAAHDVTNRAGYLTNLSGDLYLRYEAKSNRADLNAAVEAGREAVAVSSPAGPDHAKVLAHLADVLGSRFTLTGNDADLDDAIDAGWQAVAAVPSDHPQRASMLTTLGGVLSARASKYDSTANLNAVVDVAHQAVDATPDGHPDLTLRLHNFGRSLYVRFEQAGDLSDLGMAMNAYRQASSVSTGTPVMRLTAARAWGRCAASSGRTREAAEGYEAAVSLLPSVAWHGLDRATRQRQLEQSANLAADAAVCAALDGHADRAVELAEQSRSLLWTQALNLRSDLSELAERAPDLAERLTLVGTALSSPSSGAMDYTPDARRQLAREWDELLTRIRALKGFEHFHRAVPYTELVKAASNGPVIIINASAHGGHALIIRPYSSQPQVVDLPQLSRDEAIDRCIEMFGTLTEGSGSTAMIDLLDWLWHVIASPVLTALGCTRTPRGSEHWPRIWWCPTGPLTILPLHAAGRRTATGLEDESVLDRVVSSYTPTLGGLIRARGQAVPPKVRHFTIGMPETPGLARLSGVNEEREVLARHFPPGQDNHVLVGTQATTKAALTQLATHSWVHFACHASAEDEPDQGGFALWDGRLSLRDLAGQEMGTRELAFLSACETATGSMSHLDESLHLAAAMQFLGYRHIIASLWPITDFSAPEIANQFYSALKTGDRLNSKNAAEALHHAVRALRSARPTAPTVWAPYIHLGP
jgi:hypothetical protein